MPDVSLTRLYVLRFTYLVLFLLAPWMTAAGLLFSARAFAASDGWGFTACLLAAMMMLAALGVRYPLKMLPLLIFELLWKTLWILRIAVPLWRTGQVDEALINNTVATGTAVVFLAVIPWRYVIQQYLRAPADPWRRTSTA